MHYLTRRETFNAAHRVYRPDLSDEENYELFGKCANPHWHGHNYTLFVTIKGEPDPYTGYLMDLKKLKGIIHQVIIEKVDHKNLNIQVDFLQGMIVSTENMVKAFYEQLQPVLAGEGVLLHSVKLYETENNICEYIGG
ncbi:MAG: 6-carboxytetrahydropterin synthase [Marinifilaceae bacterium]